MRAKYIHEELGFERTGDVKKGLGIGYEAKVKKWIQENFGNIKYYTDDKTVVIDEAVYSDNLNNIPFPLVVNGAFDLPTSPIEVIDASLSVRGEFDLNDSQIMELPEGLEVSGNLLLHDTPIRELPKNLYVGRGINLIGSKVKNVPESAKIGSKIYITSDQNIDIPQSMNNKVKVVDI
jgi:hypothetical protein